MSRTPPKSTRTDTLFPYTTLFRSAASKQVGTQRQGGRAGAHVTQISPLRPYQAREGGTIYMISTPKPFDRSEGAKRDIIAGGIVVAAILLFVGTGSNVKIGRAACRARG